MLKVCLSKPVRDDLFYFKALRTFDRTLLEVIGVPESESDIIYQLLLVNNQLITNRFSYKTPSKVIENQNLHSRPVLLIILMIR